jgi:hypothetical protein
VRDCGTSSPSSVQNEREDVRTRLTSGSRAKVPTVPHI